VTFGGSCWRLHARASRLSSGLPAYALSVLAGILYRQRPIRIIQFDSIGESIFWTLRAWYWRYPVPLDTNQWRLTDPYDVALYRSEALAIQGAWKFLGPFLLPVDIHYIGTSHQTYLLSFPLRHRQERSIPRTLLLIGLSRKIQK
jgi:hypothetical protein